MQNVYNDKIRSIDSYQFSEDERMTTEYRWKGKWITRYRIAEYLVTLFIIKLIPRVIHMTHGNIREY